MLSNINVIADAAAQSSGSSGAASGGIGAMFGNSWWLILIYGAIIVAVYFFLIRPNSKKKKEEAQMRNSLEIGDEITTIGGIMGRVVAIKDDEDAIIIETGSDRVKMKFKKWCISSVDTVKEPKAQAATEEKKGLGGLFKRKKKEEAADK